MTDEKDMTTPVTDAPAPAPDGAELEQGPDAEEAAEPEAPRNPNLKWYSVHTYSGYEARAKQCLADRVQSEKAEFHFGDVLIPTEEIVDTKGGSKRTTTRKLYPGYMFVEMELNDETWHLVNSTQKITGFVGANKRRPMAMREREIGKIKQQMEQGTTAVKPKQNFEEGAQVRVTDGPFMNFTGTVEEVRPDKQKLRVLVSIFGRATPVELDFIQVERV